MVFQFQFCTKMKTDIDGKNTFQRCICNFEKLHLCGPTWVVFQLATILTCMTCDAVFNITSWMIGSLLLFHWFFVVACSFLPLRQYPHLAHRPYSDPCLNLPVEMCWALEHLESHPLGLNSSRRTPFQMGGIRQSDVEHGVREYLSGATSG